MTPISASMRGDTTAAVERVAGWLRSDGAHHPVAAAVVLAVRGHLQLTPAQFAACLGTTLTTIEGLERGEVAIGALPAALDPYLAEVPDLDLIALADLEATWR